MIRRFLALLALAFALIAAAVYEQLPEPCATDSECALLCSPTDAACDGGPQS